MKEYDIATGHDLWMQSRAERREGDHARARFFRAKDEILGWINMGDYQVVNTRLKQEFPELEALRIRCIQAKDTTPQGGSEYEKRTAEYHELRRSLCPEEASVMLGYILVREVTNHLKDNPNDEEALEIGVRAMQMLADHVRVLFAKWKPLDVLSSEQLQK